MHNAFPPLFDGQPRILILGTFPSPLSREKCEYYGNPKNQFWKLIFGVLNLPFESPGYDEKKNALFQNGIALWDVIVKCDSDNALDTSIRNPEYNTGLPSFISSNKISTVFFNGGNAYTFFRRGIGNIERNVLPSSSPANARLSFDGKLQLWSKALSEFL